MSTSVTMPALGESVTEGTVTNWLKSVGDEIAEDEALVEVATDKVDSEVPAPASGVLLKILVEEDETVEVGTEIAIIGDRSELSDDGGSDDGAAAQTPVEAAAPDEPAATPSSGSGSAPSGDITEVTMPALGESVTEGTVSNWLKSVGDKVEADEPIVEVATDKVDSEVPSPAEGYVVEILVEEDETVEVGTPIAKISSEAPSSPAPEPEPEPAPKAQRSADEVPGKDIPSRVKDGDDGDKVVEWACPPAPPAPPAPSAPSAPAAPAAPAPKSAEPKPAPEKKAESPAASTGGSYVTPIVRRLAAEKGVDLSTVTGTGVGGRIRKQDVLDAAEAAASASAVSQSDTAQKPATKREAIEPSPLRGKTEKMSSLRKVIAKRMVDSLQTAAQLTTVVEVDVTKVAALRAANKNKFLEQKGTKLTFLPFFVKAATEALLAHPKINATINDDNTVTYHDAEHIGIAVDTPKGLFVPVIRDAGDKDIEGLANAINDLASRTRDGKAGAKELSGSTFTITNTGSGGALFDTPVLNMPETAILGVGTIVKRPMVVKDSDGNEAIAVRSMVYLALSYDHRLVDGADAARYLMAVKKRLEEADFDADLNL